MARATGKASAPTGGSVRRAEILAAAAEVFAEKGIVAATVRDVGDRAGILSGSLYHHFSSKEEMIAEILVPAVRSQAEAFDMIAAETDDPVEILRRLIAAAVTQTATDPLAARILRNDANSARDLPGLDIVVRESFALLAKWRAVVARGVEAGQFRAGADPTIVSYSIADVVLGAYRFLIPVGRMSTEQVTEQLTALILSGLDAQ